MISTTRNRRVRVYPSEDEQPSPLTWGGFIIRPTDPKFAEFRHVPNVSGVYAWYSRDGDLLYIGRSTSMNSRLRGHHMPMLGGVSFSFRPVPYRHLNGVEMAHIDTLRPFQNAGYEAEHLDFWDDFCAAIDSAWRDVLPEQEARVAARNREDAARMAATL